MCSKFVNDIFIQKPVFTTVPKLELRIVLPYLGNIFSITKKRLNRCISKRCISKRWNFVSLKSFFKHVTDSRIILDLKIVFLKPYNLTLSINLSVEAAQLPITVKPTNIWRFGFQNRETSQGYVIYVSEGPHARLWPYSSLGRFLYHW